MKKSKIHISILQCMFIAAIFFVATPAIASELFFKTSENAIEQQEFDAALFIDTKGDAINAIEGTVLFPADIFEIKKIYDGDSIINFWVDKPRALSEGSVAFSGAIPGGFSGERGLVLSLVFSVKKEGVGEISLEKTRVFAHDGTGATVAITAKKTSINAISAKEAQRLSITSGSLFEKDITPPETFIPKITSDEGVFKGKWFIVFATQDKGSGIHHYEVCEGVRACVVAESPYLLKNQSRDSAVVVKAIDNNGNQRIGVVNAKTMWVWYAILITLTVVLVGFVYLLMRALWTKKKSIVE